MAERKSRDLSKYKSNPNVEKVTGSNIRFTEDFKLKAVKLYEAGRSSVDIFTDGGIDLKDFEARYASKSIKRWSEAADKYGAKAINQERRGAASTGRPGSKKFKSVNEELAYLRAENEFLKKLQALEKTYQKKRNAK